MFKPLALLAPVVASLAFAATAAPAATPTNFRVTQAVPSSVEYGGLGGLTFGTTTGAFPLVGRATMTVESFFEFDLLTFQESAGFDVLFTTARGDTLELFSGLVPDTDFLSSGTWTVTHATGRFASYSGSGSFTVSVSGTPPDDLIQTVTLTGSLRP
jgi:hypothetical protein